MREIVVSFHVAADQLGIERRGLRELVRRIGMELHPVRPGFKPRGLTLSQVQFLRGVLERASEGVGAA